MSIRKEDKFKGAIYGQLVGDAAALGTHWIYDTAELLSRYHGSDLGFETPTAGHYHDGKLSGEQTHDGDAALLLVESLAASQNVPDANDFGRRFYQRFSSPDYRAYRDHATQDTLKNIETFTAANPTREIPFAELGSPDDQMASVTALAPLLLSAIEPKSLLVNVGSFTRTRQNNSRAVAYTKTLALILLELLEDAQPIEAVQKALSKLNQENEYEREASERIEQALADLERSVGETTAKLGQSCPLPSSLPAAVHAFLKHHDDFRTAILETIKAGGDNAGRAAIVGALIGAKHGYQAIPQDWLDQLRSKDKIDSLFPE